MTTIIEPFRIRVAGSIRMTTLVERHGILGRAILEVHDRSESIRGNRMICQTAVLRCFTARSENIPAA
jgi:hypothetical protein